MARTGKGNDKRRAPNEYAVIGLGGFGGTLARRLEAMGHTVLGIDLHMSRVQAIADEITSAVALDATIEDALEEVDIAAFDTVIVALGHAFEASALVTVYLKSVGIRRVICAAATLRHQEVLRRIGADEVIVPDMDSGLRLAETLAAPHFMERVVLDFDHTLTEFVVPASLTAKLLSNVKRYDVDVVLIRRQGQLLPSPGLDTVLQEGDTLFAVGERAKLLEVAALP
jgi:trk system potassium uptake protein TrkA